MTVDLKHDITKNILLLQGPVGPFFSGLREYFLKNGADKVVKINFNAGDDFYYRDGDIIRFKDPLHKLEEFYQNIAQTHKIEAVYLFGDCRPIHQIAVKLFDTLNIPVYVFEEGYIRPHYITLEKGGVNAKSNVPRAISAMRGKVPEPPTLHHKQLGYGFYKKMIHFAVTYFMLIYIFSRKYPFYKHHKPLTFIDMLGWGLSYLRKPFYRICDKMTQQRLLKHHRKSFFFVPLQVYNDAQVKYHSTYFDVKDFIEDVLVSFSRHSEPDMKLVIKHHPLDRGHRNYKSFIRFRARTLGISNRIHYVHEVNLPKFLKAAKGTIVINSTVGLSSLFHDTAVKVMGDAFYDIGGLTYQCHLNNFWTANCKVNR
ncbi:MAG: capsular biosynthesis protein, partial [Pseudomonadota bacterium]